MPRSLAQITSCQQEKPRDTRGVYGLESISGLRLTRRSHQLKQVEGWVACAGEQLALRALRVMLVRATCEHTTISTTSLRGSMAQMSNTTSGLDCDHMI